MKNMNFFVVSILFLYATSLYAHVPQSGLKVKDFENKEINSQQKIQTQNSGITIKQQKLFREKIL